MSCLGSCAWRTTTRAYIHREFTRLALQEGKKKAETDSRPTRVITSSRDLNIIIIIARERNPPFVAVSPRTLSAIVEGERASGALNRFYRAITVRAIVRYYLETSLSILHGRVWMKGKKFPAPARASARLLASNLSSPTNYAPARNTSLKTARHQSLDDA